MDRFPGLFSGPFFALFFYFSGQLFSCFLGASAGMLVCFRDALSKRQVTAYWQWLRFCESRPRGEKRLLLINLDETSVAFAPNLPSGLVVTRSRRAARTAIRKQDTRSNLTYVATVCDDDSMQEHMPHIVITCASKTTRAQMHALRISSRPNVHIWNEEKSSWNNSKLMQRILDLISKAVAGRQDLQPVLILDVAPCHISREVMRKARSVGVWLVYVPAQVTYLVQPLDTHGFASFKVWLRQRYEDLRSASADGVVDRLQWLRTLQVAKKLLFDPRSWTHAFQDTGARMPCPRLTNELSAHVASRVARCAVALEPDIQSLSLVWPRRRRMAYAHNALFNAPVASASSQTARAVTAKRPLPVSHMSIALASISNKRACRQYPVRSVDDQL